MLQMNFITFDLMGIDVKKNVAKNEFNQFFSKIKLFFYYKSYFFMKIKNIV